MLQYYRRILDDCEPYVIARQALWGGLDLAPLGVEVPVGNVFDPQRVAHGPFMQLVGRLDELTYGPLALNMPSWVFYDCAVVPGAIFGFARRAAALPPWARKTLRVPDDYEGLVPVSMFIAIPMAHRKAQLVFTLCSLNEVAPGAAPEGLWRLTLAAGTAALAVDVMVGTVQWRSPQLGLYATLGPLKLLTAWTPAHDVRETATFYVQVDDEARGRLLRGDLVPSSEAERFVDADDLGALRALQSEVEEGVDVWVIGPAEIRGSDTRVPLTTRLAAVKPIAGDESLFHQRFQG